MNKVLVSSKQNTIFASTKTNNIMNYIEEITRIARENINKADDAGYGMYNFDIWLTKPIQGIVYPKNIVLQTYPYKEKEYYGLVYLLCYYSIDDDEINWEHDDFNFKDLSEEDKEKVYNAFRTQIGEENTENTIMEKKEIRLIDFVKKDLTLEEKVKLINAWEEDRGADGEFVYDLDYSEDAKAWIDMYGTDVLYECRKEGRYWMGGWQFSCKGKNTDKNITKAWCVQGEKLDTFFTENNLFYNIKERYDGYAKANPQMDVKELGEMVGKMYYGYIDFESYANDLKPKRYKWVAVSNDNSFQDYSSMYFDLKEDCYNSMRNAVLEKMKWNTEYKDVNDGYDEDYIGYKVHFYTDKIIHNSYSGTYLYKIVDADTKLDNTFWDNLLEEAKQYNEEIEKA